jgi:predicted DsbA family dithiol-disulfide isomerase
LRAAYEIDFRWTAFPLHPETPENGQTLEQLFAGQAVDLDQVMIRLQQTAQEAGLPFSARTMTYNSRLAQELGKWAEAEGRGEEYHRALFRAYFAEGKNIGKIEELLEVVRSLGLPEVEAERVLRERTFRKAVDSDWDRSRKLGIRAVPTFVLGQQSLVGAQPYKKLAALLDSAEVRRSRDEK